MGCFEEMGFLLRCMHVGLGFGLESGFGSDKIACRYRLIELGVCL